MEGTMKKIYMIMEDKWHKRDVIVPGMETALGASNVTAVVDPAEFPWEKIKPGEAIFVSQKGENQELPDGSRLKWITPEREKLLWDFVNAGGSALFIHCGTVLADAGELYRKLVGGIFLQHPKQCSVAYVPLKGPHGEGHPIIDGVEPFTLDDEHYHCEVNAAAVTPFFTAGSAGNATVLAGWCQEIGKGRTVVLTPGHTLEVATNPNMSRLIRNAVSWLGGNV
jgi:type 1 glutamine amidotransferase